MQPENIQITECYEDYKESHEYDYSDTERRAEKENDRLRARQRLLKRNKPIVSHSRINIKQPYNRHPKVQ